MCDHYRTLGIKKDATDDEICEAFNLATQVYGPDIDPDPEVQEKISQIKQAFEVLSDPVKRQAYDAAQADEDKQTQVEQAIVEVDVIYSSTRLTRLDEPQRVYAMVTVCCKSDSDEYTRTPANICLVVDRSTSMKENRLEIVKRNILNLFGRLSADDVFSLVTFNDRADVVIPSTTAVNLPSLRKSILGMSAEGGTEIFQGLIRGYQMLSQSIRKTESRYLMLLTDGHTYGDESSCYSMSRQAAQEGIIIQAMGIGHEWNDRFLDRLTSISGGCAQYIEKPEDLQKILDRQLNALESVYAQNLKFEFTKPEDVSIGTVFRLSPDSAPMSIESPISLGNLEYEQDQVLLFEFLVPPQAEGITQVDLANGKISMKLSGGVKQINVPCRLHLEIADTPSEDPPPEKIMRAVSRLTLYRLQAKAHSAILDDKTADATRYLQSLATHLLSQGNNDLARTVLKEAESIREKGEFSKYGEKNLKYGTRALMLPEDEGER